MYLSSPQQALCADREQVTEGIDPNSWIRAALPLQWSVRGFHFFVNWSQSPPNVGEEIWMTRLVHFTDQESPTDLSIKKLSQTFASSNDSTDMKALGRLCALYGNRLRVVFLPEIATEDIEENLPIWTGLYLPDEDFNIVTRSIVNLKASIRNQSGGPVRIGSKGLTYGTSAVECVLSQTDSSYPGDVDAVIVDSNENVRCIVEYKKHTLRSAFNEHLVSRYYPRPDGRKYQRLYALVSHYRQRTPHISFVILYYSTFSPVIRLQVVKALTTNQVIIDKDSGDWSINGMTNEQVGTRIINWLGLTK